jgi:hypothetical protein
MTSVHTRTRVTSARCRPLDAVGYVVCRQAVQPRLLDAALRRLNVEIARIGLSADEIRDGVRGTFFPHLRWDPEVLELQQRAAELVSPEPGEQWADPQLLLRFPDEAESWPQVPHIDQVPPWAGGRPYAAVVGVAITRSLAEDGCLTVWPGSHTGATSAPEPVELHPGDIVVMHPQLSHCAGLNRSAAVRYAAYFRLLASPEATDPDASPSWVDSDES